MHVWVWCVSVCECVCAMEESPILTPLKRRDADVPLSPGLWLAGQFLVCFSSPGIVERVL